MWRKEDFNISFVSHLACNCDAVGTVNGNSTICMAFGGGCGPCRPGVTGQQCDTCLNGFFRFSRNGCEGKLCTVMLRPSSSLQHVSSHDCSLALSACECDPVGSLSPICSDSGQCRCKPGVGGPTCSDCLPDYFNFTSEGCSPCECSSQFSNSPSCNITTGQCSCPDGIAGRTCGGGCSPGFFNLTTEGCQSCDCDVIGSLSNACDLTSGQCQCRGSLGGLRCSECAEGFFNTGRTGGGEDQSDSCAACVCSGRSSECSLSNEEGRLMAIHFNFSQLCSEDPGTCGDGWSVRAVDYSEDIVFGPK